MMGILKQIQRDLADQKDYIMNINEKINFMDEKMADVLVMGRLEEQVKKNNMLNDEMENHFENKTIVPIKTDLITFFKVSLQKMYLKITSVLRIMANNNADRLLEPSENNTEETQLPNSCKASEETELNNKETKNDEVNQLYEIKELRNMIKDFIEIRHTSVEEAATCCSHVAAGISPTNLNIDQVSELNDKLNNATKVYENDMREIKELIKDSIKISHMSFEETSTLLNLTQSKTSEIEDLIKDSVAASKMSFQEAIEHCKTLLRETIQSQMSETKELIKDLEEKLYRPSKLKLIAETCQETINYLLWNSDQALLRSTGLWHKWYNYVKECITKLLDESTGSNDPMSESET